MNVALKPLRNVGLALLIILTLLVVLIIYLWQNRAPLSDLGWPTAPIASEPGVTATWLGISTILFDDGETQVLIDGTFTRVHPLDFAPFQTISSDVAAINYALTTFRINRLAAIIPAHSHFDHAMDIGFIANRTHAVILGSQSTSNIAIGNDVPVDQYQTLANGEQRQFGDFTITLLASRHAPIGTNDEEWFPGSIDLPLRQPAPTSQWRTGVTWSIIIEHPRGTALVKASAGFEPGELEGVSADVAFLGIAGLAKLGEDYFSEYWEETVIASGAQRLIAVHFEDFTAPFGDVVLFPKIADDVVKTAGWIDEMVTNSHSELSIELPPFGQPIALY